MDGDSYNRHWKFAIEALKTLNSGKTLTEDEELDLYIDLHRICEYSAKKGGPFGKKHWLYSQVFGEIAEELEEKMYGTHKGSYISLSEQPPERTDYSI